MADTNSTCKTCGNALPDGAAFCMICGTALQPSAGQSPSILERLRASLDATYKVERVLGQGGMATVYLAQDLRHERQVAIKVLNPELSASVGSERFDREIRVSAKLQHPHILPLYDSGVADGLLFYVMPFVSGESLAARIKREGMLPVEDALRITVEVADALGHAHGLGIVHRDIKPENILLQGGHALVADFGIARAVDAAHDAAKLTQTGTAVGTPLYMSPEQSFGDEVGPTSDLYSLACVAYEMLTGQPPFTGANPRAIMARHTMEAVPSIRVVRDSVPPEVEEALLITLAKVPADRPQTAQQLVDMLMTPLAETSTRRVASRPRLTAARMLAPLPWWKRRGRIGAAAGLVVVLAAAGFGWRALRGQRPVTAGGADPHNVAVLYFDDLSTPHDLGYLADGLTNGLISALAEVRGLHVVSKGGVAQVRGKVLPLDSIARMFGAGALVRGSVEPDGADNVRVTVRLADASGAELERTSFRRPKADALALRDTLVQEVARLVRRRLGEEVKVQEQRAGARNVDAWVLLQRGELLAHAADSSAGAGDLAGADRAAGESDSVLALAERADARWPDPIVDRGAVAYRRSRRLLDDPTAAGRWIDIGLGHVQRAVALDDHNPDALELLGNLRYFRWLMGLERDDAKAKALLDSAQADLEQAVGYNAAQAGAWATLSHLYNQTKTGLAVNDAARRAFEADAFLDNANTIMSRLFFSSYDLAQFVDAQHWCVEGGRRFPSDPRFTECKLWLLTAPRLLTPDVAHAWALRDSLVGVTAPGDTAFQRRSATLAVAAVIARVAVDSNRMAMRDSARHVLADSRGTAAIDPTADLAQIGAFVHAQLGDSTQAVALLQQYLAANPGKRATFADGSGWWFAGLQNNAAFRRLVGR